MKPRRTIFFFVVATFILSGCGMVYQARSRETNDKLMQLSVGMSRDEVLAILGKPYSREVYGDSEFLIYETNYRSNSERERFTPILIRSGKLVGFGRNYYDDAIKSKIDADLEIKY